MTATTSPAPAPAPQMYQWGAVLWAVALSLRTKEEPAAAQTTGQT